MPSKKIAIRVYVTPEEHQQIATLAQQTGLSMSIFAKRVCLGQEVKSILDHKAILDLLRVNADMARLGGLLKMWLANKDLHHAKVKVLLEELNDTKNLVKQKVLELGRDLKKSS